MAAGSFRSGDTASHGSTAVPATSSHRDLKRRLPGLRALAALLVALLVAGGLDAAQAGTRFVQAALTQGAELALDDRRADFARPETQHRAAKPAPQAAPDTGSDETAAASHGATIQPLPVSVPDAVRPRAASFGDPHLPRLTRGPPPPASLP